MVAPMTRTPAITRKSSHEDQSPAMIRVLLLSEFPIIAWGLEKLLHETAAPIVLTATATGIADALVLLAGPGADVVLFDLDGDNGIEAIARLSSVSPARVLVLTSGRAVALRDSAVLAGARGVLSKKASSEALTQAIARVGAGELWCGHPATDRTLIHLAPLPGPRRAADEPRKIAALTTWERHTVAEIARDATASGDVLAERLNISESTLRSRLGAICIKLGLSTRLELFAFAKLHAEAGSPRKPAGRHHFAKALITPA
jgi:two-component system nitrate/nitrite response regulator NarL